MFDLLLAGGPFMFGTLAVSIVTVAIFFMRVFYLWGRRSPDHLLYEKVSALLEENRVSEALRTCAATNSPLAKIVKAALQRANRSEKEIRRAVESVAIEEIPRVRGSTVFLPQLSNLATLLGLIGTIHGLIIAFKGAGSESAAMRQEVLSRGIAIAFYNTFFGLTVATIGIVFYLVLLQKTNSSLNLLERASANIIDTLLWSREGRKAG
ncbi:MAG: MotA/TolQ/ExbB proton channel family protein [Myxococcota bacterium]